jgi:methylated-DNA-[protein]-cysteine S-methyltransferase
MAKFKRSIVSQSIPADVDSGFLQTEVGWIRASGTESAITAVEFLEAEPKQRRPVANECVRECIRQLEEYFRGKRADFELPLAWSGTPFQEGVWKALCEIPFGTTVSYAEIARRTGNARAVRAVGNANSKNRIAVVVPCHRVIASDGRPAGYAGGVWRKEWLLEHEKRVR